MSFASVFNMALYQLLVLCCLIGVHSAGEPTLYEHYTSGGIKAGLNASSPHFTLNHKPFLIYGGSFHYFRTVPQYWRSTLHRMKAAGLNTVMMYFPWAIHEPNQGQFDFESADRNIAKFLEEIKQADMFAIVRVGPYTCGEWEFGGFPGWILKYPGMKLRTNYQPFLDLVKPFLERLMAIVNRYQFSTTGGPVIMLQFENEYFGPDIAHSSQYLRYLHDLVVGSGFKQLLFTSDPGEKAVTLPIKGIFPQDDVLETANFNTNSDQYLTKLRQLQFNRPLLVSEFWPGWFDFWGAQQKHHTYSVQKFEHEMTDILFKHNSSVSIYVFFGGTNWGFQNGANAGGRHVVTSYDYNAPLTESGNYTNKYFKTRELYEKLVASGRLPRLHLPDVPPAPVARAYGKVKVERRLSLEEMLKKVKHFRLLKARTMEQLPEPQNYGFILYRLEGKAMKAFEVSGPINDRALFLVDQKEVATISAGSKAFKHAFASPLNTSVHQFDLLVENQGRLNYGTTLEQEHKGTAADIKLDDIMAPHVTAYSLDFNQTFLESLRHVQWTAFSGAQHQTSAPAMYQTHLKVVGQPADTFLKLDGWTKGNAFVNGFNIGRYWKVGPQKTLYIPGPLLKTGDNTIELFELHTPGTELQFQDYPILE